MKLPFVDYELSKNEILLIGGAFAAGTTIIAIARKMNSKPKPKNYPKDTVILHHLGRAPYCPSFIPFAVKLETYLRIAKIPYQSEFDNTRSPKGKFPWIEFNGTVMADSSFIIKFLNKYFNVDLEEGVPEAEKSAAYALQKMTEENTYWVIVYDRWLSDTGHVADIQKELKISSFAAYFLKRTLRNYMYGHGIGRHSKEELFEILRDDLNALSKFLGDKKYLLGSKPGHADCAVFGLLSQMYWQCWGSKAEIMIKEYPNLCSFCERMRDTYWPDWDRCTTKSGRPK